MRSKAGMKFECIFEEPLDFIDIDYTHLNRTIRYEQRPHGEWIWKEYDPDYDCGDIVCSKCSVVIYEGVPQARLKAVKWPFCPDCGADMRVKDELNRVSKELNSEIEKSKSEIVPDYRDGWKLKGGDPK